MFNYLKRGIITIVSFTTLLCSYGNCVKADGFANVVFVGNYQGGKTQIFRRIIGDPFESIAEATATSDAMSVVQNIRSDVDGSVITIRVWDTPGAHEYYSEIMEMIGAIKMDIICIVHDLSQDIDTSSAVGAANIEYFRNLYKDLKEKSSNCKIVFVASKVDLSDEAVDKFAANYALLESVVDFLKKAKHIDYEIISTSARTDDGIPELRNYIRGNLSRMELHPRDEVRTYIQYSLIPDPILTDRIRTLESEKASRDGIIANLTAERDGARADAAYHKQQADQKQTELDSKSRELASAKATIEENAERGFFSRVFGGGYKK